MTKKQIIQTELLNHKLNSRMCVAQVEHELIAVTQEFTKNGRDIIESAKYVFREFLETIISNENNLELPPGYSLDKLMMIYKESDFDWTDNEKYKKFTDWYIAKITPEPQPSQNNL